MEVLHKLGIDWKLLIAQGVNFLILLYILKRFVYKPMLAFLDERAGKIESGLHNAEAASKRLEEAEKEHGTLLADAQKQARSIVEEALLVAKKRDAEQLEKTKEEVATLLEAGQKNIAEESARALREAKKELGNLVVLATEKLVGIKVDTEKDNDLIQKSLS
jgi:F-type H+-transporting ATPase subunit b